MLWLIVNLTWMGNPWKGQGPIPPGTYYIFDRQSGGLLGPLRDFFTDRDEWFALYSIDERIDDETFCDKVKRGEFRLHPKGATGRSEGCIVIERESDFFRLRAILKSAKQMTVPGIELRAYGRLVVKWDSFRFFLKVSWCCSWLSSWRNGGWEQLGQSVIGHGSIICLEDKDLGWPLMLSWWLFSFLLWQFLLVFCTFLHGYTAILKDRAQTNRAGPFV